MNQNPTSPNKGNILVLDDNQNNLKLFTQILTKNEYKIQRGTVIIKGKGEMVTYLLKARY